MQAGQRIAIGVSAPQEERLQVLEKLSLPEKERKELEESSSLLRFKIENFRKGLQEEKSKHLEKLNSCPTLRERFSL